MISKGKPGFRLPSEEMLMKQYQVSRTTVRDTFKKLIGKNMIYSLQGKGYFTLNRVFWSTELSFSKKYDNAVNKLYVVNIPLDQYFLDTYQCLENDFMSLIKVRYQNDRIKKYSIIWVNKTILKNLNFKDCEDSLLYYIHSRNITLINNLKCLRLELPNAYDEKFLQLSFKTYLPKKYSITFSEYHEVVECSKETYQPELFEFYKVNYF
ncbi:GntR family transcriptional regulator [Spiroplasma endosymbiont of Phyllotreta cruciferae]|uniref:GntR family transcriptional regulator n=1 Tax=Spiroplasma endosymbiont of Phyllotreta cruciferae TaxID=2886375 RepID=UPI0020A1ACD9|nr:GntR family transcriptional regulator [Spiroplasma endosymbiont of Phyllotreta cruciferae]